MGLSVILPNLALMLAYMLASFTLVKTKVTKPDHAKSVSGLLLYVCTPCMILNAFLNMDLTKENIGGCALFFGITLFIMLLVYIVLYLVLKKHLADAKYRILIMGTIFGNVGFFGLPLVVGLFPDAPIVACYSTLFTFSMNALVYTVGVFLITTKKEYISLKAAILNPTTITMLVSFVLFAFQVKLPETVANTVSLLGKMTTPMCMFVLGMRLGSMNLKEVFGNPFAYVLCGFKLILFPLLAFILTRFVPFLDDTFKTCLVVLCSTPSAAIVLNLAELHECEQKLAANAVLVSTLLSIVTMPILLTFIG